MLVLSRKPGQTITILGNIEVSVLEVRGGQVRLGVKAPSVIPVQRTELLEMVRSQNRKAAGLAPVDIAALKSELDAAKNP